MSDNTNDKSLCSPSTFAAKLAKIQKDKIDKQEEKMKLKGHIRQQRADSL